VKRRALREDSDARKRVLVDGGGVNDDSAPQEMMAWVIADVNDVGVSAAASSINAARENSSDLETNKAL
jgi:UDP:flavonoid glycosyltransferase YjiC (YdhE family)